MAAKKKKKAAKRKGKPAELIISKARVKNAVKKCNVGGEFYGALDAVVRDRHSRIGQLQCLGLDKLEHGPFGIMVVLLPNIGQLHIVKREIPLLPTTSPILDHQWEQVRILSGSKPVGLPLVPDGTLDGIGNGRRNPTVKIATGESQLE